MLIFYRTLIRGDYVDVDFVIQENVWYLNHFKFVTVLTASTEAFLCGICINLQRNQNHKSLLCFQKAEDWKGSYHIVFIWIWLIANETYNLETVFKQLVILLYLPNSWFILLLPCLKKRHSGLFPFPAELRKYSRNHTWLPLHYILNPFLLPILPFLSTEKFTHQAIPNSSTKPGTGSELGFFSSVE